MFGTDDTIAAGTGLHDWDRSTFAQRLAKETDASGGTVRTNGTPRTAMLLGLMGKWPDLGHGKRD